MILRFVSSISRRSEGTERKLSLIGHVRERFHARICRSVQTVEQRVPPQAYFVVSAVFHYLGPAFAVLLFARVPVLGVAWLRIATAALLFALWRRPWRACSRLDLQEIGRAHV